MHSSSQFQDVLAEWDKAEQAIKIAEQVTGQVAIPSVMELRYAGRRIGEAARAIDRPEQFSHLMADAKFDCLRAQHDAIDISVNFIAKFIDEVILKTEPLALGGKYAAVKQYLQKIEDYQAKISQSRLSRERRSEIYESLQIDLANVQHEFAKFKEELIDIIEASDRYYEEQSSTRSSILIEALQAEKSKASYTFLLAATAAIGVLISAIFSLIAG